VTIDCTLDDDVAVNLHVNAVGAVMGGAQRHLGPFLTAVTRQRPLWQVWLWVSEGAAANVPEQVRVERVGSRGVVDRLRWENLELPRALVEHRADALLNLTNSAPVRSPVPSVLYQRNALYFDRAWLTRAGGRARVEASLRRALTFAQVRGSSETIVPSAAMADHLLAWRGAPADAAVRVVPHGVDLDRFAFEPRPWPVGPSLRLLHVSHASAHKDQLLLVDLVRGLADRGFDPHLSVTIAREDAPTYVDAFIARTEELHVAQRVELLGRVDHVERLLHESDIMVFPSTSESFGFPVIEAMAAGTPVLASDIPSSRELLGPDGWFFVAGDRTSATEAAVAMVAEGPAAVASKLDAANRFARTLTWDANAAAVIRSIERAVALAQPA